MEPETDPDVEWVRRLAARPRSAAESALEEAASETRLFRHLVEEHAREGRRSYVEIDAPLELFAIVRLTRPLHVVEVGVSSGVSSAYLLQAMDRNGAGTLHSVDKPQRVPVRAGARPAAASWSLPPGRSSGWAVPDRLRPRWDLRIGDKRTVLPLLSEELPRIDLLVYDVPHRDRDARQEFSRLDARMPPGAIAIVDHGPGGELCSALKSWAAVRRGLPSGRKGLGLYGFRCAGLPVRTTRPGGSPRRAEQW